MLQTSRSRRLHGHLKKGKDRLSKMGWENLTGGSGRPTGSSDEGVVCRGRTVEKMRCGWGSVWGEKESSGEIN